MTHAFERTSRADLMRLVAWMFLVVWLSVSTVLAHPIDDQDDQNVVWNTPSKDSSGSMPLGNGRYGLNVWVEKGGDLLFYISSTDVWSSSTPVAGVNPFVNPFRFSVNERLEILDAIEDSL